MPVFPFPCVKKKMTERLLTVIRMRRQVLTGIAHVYDANVASADYFIIRYLDANVF